MIKVSELEIGKRFGDWTLMSHLVRLPGKSYKSLLVKCECNHEQFISSSSLLQGKSTKCKSCSKKERKSKRNLPIGSIYGEWEVIGDSFIDGKNNTRIPVRCSCGYETNINKYCLLNKNESLSCKSCSLWRGVGDLSQSFIGQMSDNARKRGFSFNTSTKFLWELLKKQQFKCALTNVDIKLSGKKWREYKSTASLDRIDSNIGYEEYNVQWVHKDINRLKSNFPENELVYWANLITLHNKNK